MPVNDESSDQMAEALRRQREHGERAAWIDRRGWSQEQWADDAERLMHDIDGAITSLVNGHVNALIRERRALRAALATRPQPLFEGTVTSAPHHDRAFVPRATIRLDEHVDVALGQRVVVYAAPAGLATPTTEGDDG